MRYLLGKVITRLRRIPGTFDTTNEVTFEGFDKLYLPVDFARGPCAAVTGPGGTACEVADYITERVVISIPLTSAANAVMRGAPVNMGCVVIIVVFERASLVRSVEFEGKIPFSPATVDIGPVVETGAEA